MIGGFLALIDTYDTLKSGISRNFVREQKQVYVSVSINKHEEQSIYFESTQVLSTFVLSPWLLMILDTR